MQKKNPGSKKNFLSLYQVEKEKMSLTSIHNDASAIRQEIADSRNVYAYQANPVSNFRQYPGPQARGVFVNGQGNAQAHVDVESLLRNQSFISSSDPQYRLQADACFIPYMQQPQQLACSQPDLAPQVEYHSRACDPLSGVTIDRFVPLIHPGAGYQYGYAQFGQDTVSSLKDQLARQRIPQ